ncbi:DUF4129 domain-containing protein [Flaviflexus huanghaiensis]|uniref:DUF4129 domain-containing protein n=1 Tax=Flaviflexus huanghaiensis TaxID=1111473 RepID=UPI0015FE71A5|nr:DUF4129 domain-containing protein [Flaviflexus huanghaiensis]
MILHPALGADLSPEGDEARRWAEDELRQAKYSEPGMSLIERLGLWVLDILEKLNVSFGADAAWTGSITLIILVVIIAASTIIYGRLRSRTSANADRDIVLDDDRSAERLLRDAKRAHSAGDYSSASVDYYRACIRILDRRGLIVATPGVTARESAVQGTAATGLPLAPGAHIFDAVLYGGEKADAEDADMLAGLVDQCRAGAPV